MKPLIALTAIATFISTIVTAAPVELAVSSKGDGVVTLAGVTAGASIANVVLKKDGKFSIGLVGGQDTRISGRWQVGNGDNVLLRIEEAAGKDANGTGNVHLHLRRDGNYEVESLDATATTDRGVAVRLRFAASRPVLPPVVQPPVVVLQSTQSGRGVFRAAAARGIALTHAHVQLASNGRAFVNLYGDITLGYVGTWKNAGPGTKTLDLSGGIAGELITGAVRFDRDGRGFTRIELSGTHRRQYYSIEFDAPRR